MSSFWLDTKDHPVRLSGIPTWYNESTRGPSTPSPTSMATGGRWSRRTPKGSTEQISRLTMTTRQHEGITNKNNSSKTYHQKPWSRLWISQPSTMIEHRRRVVIKRNTLHVMLSRMHMTPRTLCRTSRSKTSRFMKICCQIRRTRSLRRNPTCKIIYETKIKQGRTAATMSRERR